MNSLSNKSVVLTPNIVQNIKYICSTLFFIALTHSIINAQFWSHSFESNGGYTASITEFSDGGEDYCGRIDLTNKVMTNGA